MDVYTVRDNKAGTFNTPFFQPTDIHALRAFKTEVNRAAADNMIYLYPEEFDLVHIGNFDEKKGVLDGTSAKGLLANAATLKATT